MSQGSGGGSGSSRTAREPQNPTLDEEQLGSGSWFSRVLGRRRAGQEETAQFGVEDAVVTGAADAQDTQTGTGAAPQETAEAREGRAEGGGEMSSDDSLVEEADPHVSTSAREEPRRRFRAKTQPPVSTRRVEAEGLTLSRKRVTIATARAKSPEEGSLDGWVSMIVEDMQSISDPR